MNIVKLIGITGSMKTGKTTLANGLKDYYEKNNLLDDSLEIVEKIYRKLKIK